MKKMTFFCFLLLITLLAAIPAASSEETVLTVGEEKVSHDEILYLIGIELGESDALAAVAAREMSLDERAVFLDRVSMALLFSRGAILKGIHLDPRIAAQIRWNQINLLANAYIASLSHRLSFEEKDVRAYYEKHREKYVRKSRARVRQIFTFTEEKSRSALLAVLSGEDFSSVAARFGDENSTAAAAGADAWIDEGELPESLNKLVFTIPLRSVSGPVEAGRGYFIVEVLERIDGGTLTFGEAREMVRSDLEHSVLSAEAATLRKRYPVTSSPELMGQPHGR
jgi:peptidyl-prolyl cis-trans isomerase C